MTLANKLTCLRMILIIPLIIIASLRFKLNFPFSIIFAILALIIFVVACITDYFDGKIARETDTVTDFGKLTDPIADKLLTFSFLFVAVKYGKLSSLIVLVMLIREIIVTYERLQLAKNNYGVMSASKLGKIKTVVVMVTIVLIIILPAYKVVNNILMIPAMILTVLSGIDYHIKVTEYLKGEING